LDIHTLLIDFLLLSYSYTSPFDHLFYNVSQIASDPVLPKRDGAVRADLQAAVTANAAPMVASRLGMEGNGSCRTFFPTKTAADTEFSIESDSQPGKELRKINQIGEICRQRLLERQTVFTTITDGLDLGAPDAGIPVRIDFPWVEAHYLRGDDIRGTGRCAGHKQSGMYGAPGGPGAFSLQPHNTVNDIQLRLDLLMELDEEPGERSWTGQYLVISLLDCAGDASIEILYAEGHTSQTVGLHLRDIDDAIHLEENLGQRYGADLASKGQKTLRFAFKIDQSGISGKSRDITDAKGIIGIIKGAFSYQNLHAGRFEDYTELFQNNRMGSDRPIRFYRRHEVGLDEDPRAWPKRDIEMGKSLFERLAHFCGIIGITADTTDTVAVHGFPGIKIRAL
jgi:hypothetical protein